MLYELPSTALIYTLPTSSELAKRPLVDLEKYTYPWFSSRRRRGRPAGRRNANSKREQLLAKLGAGYLPEDAGLACGVSRQYQQRVYKEFVKNGRR